MKEKKFYQLVEEDVQMVAEETLGRRLNSKEISSIKDSVAEKINWFEAIELSINETIAEN